MEISEFLENFNNSNLGKRLRAHELTLSQEAIDEFNQKYGSSIDADLIERMVQFGLLEKKLSKEAYAELIEKNGYKFSNIEDIKTALSRSLSCESLTAEDIQFLKQALEFSGVTKIRIDTITPDVADLSELPLETLELRFGEIAPETVAKFPNIKNLIMHNVAFHSISELESLGLEALDIYINPDDPQLDMTAIDKFKTLKSFKISGQTLSQEDFEKICTLSELTELDIGNGKVNENYSTDGNNITDYSSVFNLEKLEQLDSSSILSHFCTRPVVRNIEEFRKVVALKAFQNDPEKKITYIGSEELPADLLDGLDKVELILASPLAIGREFAEKYESGFLGKLSIAGDSYEEYTAPELYAINKKMREVIDGIPKDASEFEKVAAIYKAIGETCFYDRTGCVGEPEYIEGRECITRSLRGCFIENKLVCRGFALSFKKLADEVGLESTVTSGDALGENGELLGSHAWNQVKVDGKWYNLDLTWDARSIKGNNQINYLLLSDQEFNKEHKAYNVDKDVRAYSREDGFDYKGYESFSESPVHECGQSFDKEKIAEYFGSNARQIQDSQAITSTITHSETVTMMDIESNMIMMAAVEQARENNTQEKETEERDG